MSGALLGCYRSAKKLISDGKQALTENRIAKFSFYYPALGNNLAYPKIEFWCFLSSKRLGDISNNIVLMLDTDSKSHITLCDAGCDLFCLGKLGMCG